jgi:hypothetical protein
VSRTHLAIVLAFLFAFGCASRDESISKGAIENLSAVANASGLGECLDSCRGIGQARLFDTCKIGCYINDAKSSRDPASCDPIRGFNDSSMYYSSCLGNVAGLQANVSVCDRSRNVSEKDWCILTSAERIKDTGICDPVNDSVIRSACIDSANSTFG